MKNIKWLFFDMGGVILNDDEPEKLRQSLLFEVIKKYIPNLTMKDVYDAWMVASQQLGSVRILALRELMKNSPLLEQAEAEFIEIGNPDYQGLSFIRPEAKEVLATLSKKYNLGITANQSIKTTDRLNEAGILPYFSHQKMSDHIGLAKPDPNFFTHILKDCNALPEESAIIDDNWYRSLVPAKNLGMTTVHYHRDIIPYPPNITPDYTITILSDLLKYF